jgi:prolyl-tRNA synthetase
MRLSQNFSKTRKEAPRDEEAKNAQLLIRAGFIYKDAAGVYALLPLGLRVLNNIIQIIREEMNAVGAQELSMTTLQRRELWEQTDRWDDAQVDVWFKTRYKSGTEAGLAWSHEEQLTEMMRGYISSYRDLPAAAYQFQTKLRNETRAKSGILRTREFIMKDLYSFNRNEAEHSHFYEKVQHAYVKIFDRIGIGEQTFLTVASGGPFAKFSHEFQTVTEAGEDEIYLDRQKRLAVNQEVHSDEVIADLGLDKDSLEKVRASEVGNIFNLGTSKSQPLDLYFVDEDDVRKPVIMGSYGIGPARVMGVVVELFSDERGLVWPKTIAPAQVHIVRIGDNEAVVQAADKVYADLSESKIEVLYDDRDASAGAKFADADLIGVPLRLTISPKTLEQHSVELKNRTQDSHKLVKLADIAKSL